MVLSSCAGEQRYYVTMSNPQVQFIEGLSDEYENLLNKTTEEIRALFGKPAKRKKYKIDGHPREQYVYYLIDSDNGDAKKIIELYFKEDCVSGYNILSGDTQEEKPSPGRLGQQVALGGM